MKKFLFLLLILAAIGCKPKQKVIAHEKANDGDVLRPPEGYGNSMVTRAEKFNDSVVAMQNAAARAMPQPCIQVTGLGQTGVTANTASFKWTSTGAKKYYVYKNGSYVGTALTNSYTEQGLLPSMSYQFSVAGVGKGNKICPMSAQLVITTLASTDPQPPPTPSGAAQVIFLQFDPCTVDGTAWGYPNGIVSSGSGLTEDKRLEIFNYFKEAYRNHPRLSFTMDSTVWLAADPNYSQELVFMIEHEWYCGSKTPCAGGVSFVGSFNTRTVNFVFTAALNYVTLNCKVAGIHEAGHGLGCYHAVDSCGQAYGKALLCSDGIWRAKIMGGSYTTYEHYFQTPTRCAGFGVPCITSQGCTKPDEDQIIEAHIRQN